MLEGTEVIDHGSSRAGRWLRARRVRLVLWIAVVEGVVVWLAPDISKWTVVVVAALAIGLYVVAGRTTRSDTGHQVSWILAASQALAVVVTSLAFILPWMALALVVVFAAIALLILLADR